MRPATHLRPQDVIVYNITNSNRKFQRRSSILTTKRKTIKFKIGETKKKCKKKKEAYQFSQKDHSPAALFLQPHPSNALPVNTNGQNGHNSPAHQLSTSTINGGCDTPRGNSTHQSNQLTTPSPQSAKSRVKSQIHRIRRSCLPKLNTSKPERGSVLIPRIITPPEDVRPGGQRCAINLARLHRRRSSTGVVSTAQVFKKKMLVSCNLPKKGRLLIFFYFFWSKKMLWATLEGKSGLQTKWLKIVKKVFFG